MKVQSSHHHHHHRPEHHSEGRNDRRGYTPPPPSASSLSSATGTGTAGTTHRYSSSHGSNTDDERRGSHQKHKHDNYQNHYRNDDRVVEAPYEYEYGNRGDRTGSGSGRYISGRNGGGGSNRNDGERGRGRDYYSRRRDSYDSRDGSHVSAGERDERGGGGGGRRGRVESFSRHDSRRGDGGSSNNNSSSSRHRDRDDYYGRQEQVDDYYDEGHPKRRRLSEDRGREHHRRGGGSGGGNRRSSGRHSHPPPPMKKKKSEWPSAFEESGANYVFDSRSGLFYEAESDFFYDPKNKLYYSNEKKVYYRYNPNAENNNKKSNNESPKSKSDGSKRSVWEEVKPEDGAMGGPGAVTSGGNGVSEGKDISQDLVVQALQGGAGMSANKPETKKINICIKKKFTSGTNVKQKKKQQQQQQSSKEATTVTISSNSSPNNASKALQEKEKVSLAEKARGADIEKWIQRAGEAKVDDSNMCAAIDSTGATSSKKIKLTKAGKPICFICKRKFPDLEKLKQHEQLSALHKQNLAKMKKLEELRNNKAKASEYRDRAKERRFMYEADTNAAASVPSIDPSIAEMGPSLDRARLVTTTEKVAPDQSLGESNVGNQLLQKLGWKNGGSLGRRGSGSGVEGKDVVFKAASAEMKDKLKQDWERIEQLSGKN